MKGKNFQIFGRSSGVLFPDDGTLQEEHVWEGWNEEFSNGHVELEMPSTLQSRHGKPTAR